MRLDSPVFLRFLGFETVKNRNASRLIPFEWKPPANTTQLDAVITQLLSTLCVMMYAKTSIAYVASLLALCVENTEAFVPLGGAVGLSKGSSATTATWRSAVPASCRTRRRSGPCMSSSDEHDILLRVAKGEKTDRAPVWLMRQVSAAAAVLLR